MLRNSFLTFICSTIFFYLHTINLINNYCINYINWRTEEKMKIQKEWIKKNIKFKETLKRRLSLFAITPQLDSSAGQNWSMLWISGHNFLSTFHVFSLDLESGADGCSSWGKKKYFRVAVLVLEHSLQAFAALFGRFLFDFVYNRKRFQLQD